MGGPLMGRWFPWLGVCVLLDRNARQAHARSKLPPIERQHRPERYGKRLTLLGGYRNSCKYTTE
jgi:hypothetical protein